MSVAGRASCSRCSHAAVRRQWESGTNGPQGPGCRGRAKGECGEVFPLEPRRPLSGLVSHAAVRRVTDPSYVEMKASAQSLLLSSVSP